MVKVIEALNNQVTSKGQEINDYKEKNNIKIKNRDDMPTVPEHESDKKSQSQGVLVDAKP